jgi:hypothetical protein
VLKTSFGLKNSIENVEKIIKTAKKAVRLRKTALRFSENEGRGAVENLYFIDFREGYDIRHIQQKQWLLLT